jgi:hypothetical protein
MISELQLGNKVTETCVLAMVRVSSVFWSQDLHILGYYLLSENACTCLLCA